MGKPARRMGRLGAANAATARVGLVVALAGPVCACTLDPSAPLIALPERPATILPSQALEVQANGFPNILADPAPVAGLPRSERAVAADVAVTAREGAAAQRETANLPPPSIAASMRARARTHVEEARRTIEATGRPQTGVRDLPATLAAPRPAAAEPNANPLPPARPLDPDAPVPRAVGVPPFTGAPQ